MAVHDRRLDEARLDEVTEGMVDELRPILVGFGVDTALGEPRAELSLVARPELERLERVDEADATPRRFQIDLMPAKLRDRRAEHVERDLLEHRLDPVHRVAEVGVRLVPLEHRELRLVLVRDALVAEVLADLVDPLEATDDEPLEVELGRDAQVEVGVELVRASDERVRERPAVARLKNRCLDLHEPFCVEVATYGRDDLRPQEKQLARLLVHEQIEIALAIAGLGVGDAVERVRQRARVAGEHGQLVHGERGLATTRLRGMPDDADDVPEMDADVTDASGVAHELDPPRAVHEVEEDELAHLAPAP